MELLKNIGMTKLNIQFPIQIIQFLCILAVLYKMRI